MSTPHRIALITGASRGLGLALLTDLVHDGWHVVADARDGAALAAATTGPDVTAVAGDVTDPAHRARLAEVVDDLGGLDLLVHNASLLGPSPQPDARRTTRSTCSPTCSPSTSSPRSRSSQRCAPLMRPEARVIMSRPTPRSRR